MSLKIGNTELKYGLLLAPLAGVTDRSFRKVCREHGAEYLVTEMVSAKALHFNDEDSKVLCSIDEEEQPTAVQIFGHEPDIMAEAATKILSEINTGKRTPPAIDINMGCPMKKIVCNGEGSALMKDIPLAEEIIKGVVTVSSVPVTVKFRTGWNEENKNAVKLAEICEKCGVSAVTVHGRTREGMYTPPVDLKTIADVKRAVSIPVIGNGGIFTADDALKMLDETRCDGLMIARGSMGNPWLFEEIKARIDGREYIYPTVEEKVMTALKQTEDMIKDKGERVALLEARRQISYYIKGEIGAAEARGRLNTSSSFEEIESIIKDFLCGYKKSFQKT